MILTCLLQLNFMLSIHQTSTNARERGIIVASSPLAPMSVVHTRALVTKDTSEMAFIVINTRVRFIAEFLRAKRASGAPWVRIFGKPMRPRKFGCVRPPAHPPARVYRLAGRGRGVPIQFDRGGGRR